MTMTKTARPRIAPGTVNYLTDLVQKRDVEPGKDAATCLAELTRWLAKPTTTQKDASDMIDRVKGKPMRLTAVPAATIPATPRIPYPSVPASIPDSKFAIMSELLNEIPDAWKRQELVFFEVKKFRGRRVIRRLVGAPGRFSRTTLPAAAAAELLGHLENEVFAYQASKTFGEHYTCCSRCAAELTDDLSRERVMGPICWGLMEPWRKAYLAAAAK